MDDNIKCPKCHKSNIVTDKNELNVLKAKCDKYGAKKMCTTCFCSNIKCKTPFYISDDTCVIGHDPFCEQLIAIHLNKAKTLTGTKLNDNTILTKVEETNDPDHDVVECPKCKTKIKLM